MRLRVIDLDLGVAAQEPLRRRIDAGAATRIDAADLACRLRIVASRGALQSLASRLQPGAGGGREITVTFYGSGDFHHLTASLVATVDEDVTIIHFDNHPDWVRFPATVNCGAWVNRALELPQVRKVVTIGPCSDDLVRPELQFANLGAVRDGRIALFPWRHAPSRVWGRYGSTASYRQEGRHLHWRNLADEDWDDFLGELIAAIPTRAVWLTIDKDVLGPQDACTNWDQGELPLGHLLSAVERLAQERSIAGIDVCGDWSEPLFADPFRAALAWFDHPKAVTPAPAALARNGAVNAALIDCFERVLA
ncbi:arginase family protein [Bosea sp. (in: a-proteobacteria)]|uniref:arginase family protein n=1 Tax=Bosea sp. (in: a-proteobacteria) TaxID=1871050 RepID=UPI001222551D|nr:arginase family protein [Bosea sp. (in: a-proteobacteria)]TAJ28405.1 MAG: arginase [Bosea sp. (in: a-proteobacteria)]